MLGQPVRTQNHARSLSPENHLAVSICGRLTAFPKERPGIAEVSAKHEIALQNTWVYRRFELGFSSHNRRWANAITKHGGKR